MTASSLSSTSRIGVNEDSEPTNESEPLLLHWFTSLSRRSLLMIV